VRDRIALGKATRAEDSGEIAFAWMCVRPLSYIEVMLLMG
jgi:hypothetical protein